jgi:branched-chain amino acid transport system substrate-binding protein
VIAHGLQTAASADPTAVRDAIAGGSVDTLLASGGPIAFDEKGENRNAIPILMQVQGGTVRQVHPDSFAEAAPVYPGQPALASR